MEIRTNHEKSKVLIVDDHYRNIELLLESLSDDNLELISVGNGKEALKLIQKQLVDLILLDILMPEMDGFEVCEHLKADPRTAGIPVIFLTARTDTKDIVKGFQLGAVDYITKPFNYYELISRVNIHLELKKSHDIIRRQNEQLNENNRELDRKNRELVRLNGMKDTFFNIIARDLKEPFSILIGSSNMLTDRIDLMDTEKIKRFNKIISKTSQSGYNLLKNLLDWSKLQIGTIEFNPRSIEFNEFREMIGHFIGFQNSVSKTKNIQTEVTITPKASTQEKCIFADSDILESVMRNLLSNAFKFAQQDGKVEVVIDLNDASDMVVISVNDNGIGIKENEIEKLFRIDIRQAIIGTSTERGTGLGLILSKELAEKNNGTIWAESKYGHGSSFKFTLPLK